MYKEVLRFTNENSTHNLKIDKGFELTYPQLARKHRRYSMT